MRAGRGKEEWEEREEGRGGKDRRQGEGREYSAHISAPSLSWSRLQCRAEINHNWMSRGKLEESEKLAVTRN